MRSLPVLLLLAAGCASGGTAHVDDPSVHAAPIFTSDKTGTLMGSAPVSSSANIAATPENVASAVKAVFADWQIPVTVDNPAAHQLGNREFTKTRSLAGEPMTRLIDCGMGITGPKAASFRIYGSLMTMIEPDGKGGSNLRSTFTAQAQDIEGGNSADRIVCGTNGTLELKLVAAVRQKLGLH